ncbi:MAG: CinA family protein [Bdellovibrionota bacterium]
MRREHVALVEELCSHLRSRSETLSLAESCTGGLLSSIIASVSGVSDVYNGAIVAYSNRVKENILQVPSTLIRSVGAVSTPVARAMASGARDALDSDWAISITGIAGPGGGTEQKPVGTVCFGLRGPGVDKAEQVLFKGSRQVIQAASAEYAIRFIINELDGSGKA